MAILLGDQLKGLISTTTGNLTLIDTETRIQLYSNTLQDIGIDVKEDNKKLQGGIGNPVIYSWGENRQISVSVSDAVSRLNWTAAKLGQELKKGNVLAFKEAQTYIVKSNSITLDAEPATNEKPQIFDLQTGIAIDPSKITISEKTKVTFESSLLKDGAVVYVNGYNVPVKDSLYIDIDANKFAKTFEVIITNPIVMIDENGVPTTKFIRQYRFPLGRLSGDFKDDLKSKSDGGKMDSKIEILKPMNDSKMGRIMIIPIEQVPLSQLKQIGFIEDDSKSVPSLEEHH